MGNVFIFNVVFCAHFQSLVELHFNQYFWKAILLFHKVVDYFSCIWFVNLYYYDGDIFFDEENIIFTCIFIIQKLFNLDLDFLKKVKIETKSWSKIPSYPFTIFILFFLFRESGKRTMDSISVQLCPLLVVPLPKLI